nr:hypothetical protein [Brachybacterium sp. Z12]
MSVLMTPLELGELTLPNRIVMAPLTRARTGDHRIPGELNAEYYAQRAGAGLIISEATSVSPQGVGYHGTPASGTTSRWRAGGRSPTRSMPPAAGSCCSCGTWAGSPIPSSSMVSGPSPRARSPLPGAWHGCAPSARTSSPGRWRPPRSPASSRTSDAAPRTRSGPASTGSRSTARTAT